MFKLIGLLMLITPIAIIAWKTKKTDDKWFWLCTASMIFGGLSLYYGIATYLLLK